MHEEFTEAFGNTYVVTGGLFDDDKEDTTCSIEPAETHCSVSAQLYMCFCICVYMCVYMRVSYHIKLLLLLQSTLTTLTFSFLRKY